MLAAPAGAARKELCGKIKWRDFRGAYIAELHHHAFGAWVICFESRCELGKIEAPHRKSQRVLVRLAPLGD